eukprot:TRINITY_DN90667_c0_g1_i1.p1 TRINITY_DN90667_c0_g1~~TRINITY_DN90667_c0_g1_i1.p1  ORF type:complete len:544 (+),score=126.29 TRINITY_DN90667_c0_g1_i1:69-1700(+)
MGASATACTNCHVERGPSCSYSVKGGAGVCEGQCCSNGQCCSAPCCSAPSNPAKPGAQTRHVSFGGVISYNRGRLEDRYDIDLAKPLGFGAFSRVYQCSDKQTAQLRAAKVVNCNDLRSPDAFEEEVRILQLLDHPNVLRLVETFEDEHHVCLVTELCEGGELFDLCLDEGPFTEPSAGRLLCQMLRAVAYLHRSEVIHRDLKAENWLLASKAPPEVVTVKLADFGFARSLRPGDLAQTKIGTPYYVAPEVLEGSYDSKADVWSLGIVLHMMLTGSPPFTGSSGDVIKQISTRSFNVRWLGKSVSKIGKELLGQLLKRDPQQRPSALEALQHKWVQRFVDSIESKEGKEASESMKRFTCEKSRLVKATLGVIATQLSREALEDLEKTFTRMDRNGDGSLTAEELEQALSDAGVCLVPGEAAQIVEQLDIDNSGSVDFSEFLAATVTQAKTQREDACRKAFCVFDVDGSGYIDRAELGNVLLHGGKGLTSWDLDDCFGDGGDAEIDEIYAELDADGDGKIDFEEFMAVMNHRGRRARQRARGGG